MGEGRYRTLLCLIQLAVRRRRAARASRIEIVDPLEDEARPATARSREVLADPAIEIVVHAGRQDIALLRRTLGREVTGVFDTQVAAGLPGCPRSARTRRCWRRLLGVRLAKSASFTRWDARPLSPEQLSYAREDVVHLLELAAELQSRLERDRAPGVGARGVRVPGACERRARPRLDLRATAARQEPERRLAGRWRASSWSGASGRRPSATGRCRACSATAALVEVAKRRPSSPRKLEEIRGVGQGSLRRRGEELLKAVERGLQRPQQPPGGRIATRAPAIRRTRR